MNRPALRWTLAGALLAASVAVHAAPRPLNNVLLAATRILCDLLALAAIRRRDRSRESGRPWTFLQAGMLLFLLGDLVAGVAFLRTQAMPVPEWASALLLHFLPLPMLVLAMLAWAEDGGEMPRSPRPHALLDGILFAYSTCFLIWVVGIRLWEGASRSSQASSSLFGRFLLLGLLLGACVYRGSRNPERWRGPLLYLGSAFLLLGVSSALSAASILGRLGPGYRIVAGVLKVGALLLVAQSAWTRLPLEGRVEGAAQASFLGTFRDHLPFVPAALATLAALAVGALQHQAVDHRIVLFGAPIVGLLLVRQVLAFHDLKRFSAGLEAQVEARTRALERAQAASMRTERMNAVAMLGAGLAHDLNNSLTTIRAYAELLAEELRDGGRNQHRDLDRILVAADQAAGLSRRLMAFGRADEPACVLDLHAELLAMEDLLRMLLPRRIKLRLLPGRDPCPVSGSRSHLEQILVNLVSNARDAIDGEGEVTLHLSREAGGPAGAEAVVRVQDTGCGIPPEVRARLFEPFFTTKAPGKGTGLGLSSVRALLEQAAGRIEVDSQPGLGTTFGLHFPIAVEVPAGS